MTEGGSGAALEGFAKDRELAFTRDAELPAEGELLGRDSLEVLAAATGELPGGETGALAHVTYTYRSGDSTHTATATVVVIRIPETIGFAPYVARLPGKLHVTEMFVDTRAHELDAGGRVRVQSGIDARWLRELFSPAFSDWLARSPEDFGFELAHGVLAVARAGHLTRGLELESLCGDAARIGAALRAESLEEVETGGAARTAAKGGKKEALRRRMFDTLLPLVSFSEPPRNVPEAEAPFRDLIARRPGTYVSAFWLGLAWALGVNVIGGGIFGLLLNLPSPGVAVAIFEAIVLALAWTYSYRHIVSDRAKQCGEEAFYREYARSRGLRLEPPTRFAATHAKAELPGKPERVLAGDFDGTAGALVLTGDGLTRGDRIALVGGPTGPTASAELELSAPGVTARALDDYSARLAAELRAGTRASP